MNKDKRKSILLIEDDELFRESIQDTLEKSYRVLAANSAEEARAILKKNSLDLVLLDINLPGIDGIEMLKEMKSTWSDLAVVMLTAVSRIPKVVESMKLGADDYLVKPIRARELLVTIERALESLEIRRELEQRRHLQLATNREHRLMGTSAVMDRIRKEIRIVGKTDSPVLIEGETGTGKELVARAIHAASARASRPFVAINCGAIPKDLMESELFGHKKGAFTGAQSSQIGKFQLANQGTLLLDEIGELPLEAQIKLLRVLEEQEFDPVGSSDLVKVDVRIIASTNRNLRGMIEENAFREDLFFRLNVFSIYIPPLRERPEDIIDLVEFYMDQFNQKFGKSFREISPGAREMLLQHPWKGNVRELRNSIERIILYEDGPEIKKENIEFYAPPTKLALRSSSVGLPENGLDAEMEALEKRIILRALEQAKYNKTEAARLLKLSPPAFYYRLEKHGLY